MIRNICSPLQRKSFKSAEQTVKELNDMDPIDTHERPKEDPKERKEARKKV
jgi:hypothetical protein